MSAPGSVRFMRILVVGAGGVGAAIASIAERREFFEHLVLADVDLDRAERAVSRLTDGSRFAAARVDASDAGSVAGARSRGAGRRRGERVRPAAQPTDLRRRVRGRMHVPRHGDAPLAAAPRPAVRGAGREARRRAVRRQPTPGRSAGSSRSSGSASSPDSPTCSPGTPPTTSSPRSTRSGSATAQPRHRRLRLRADVLDLDDDRRVPEPAGHLGAGPWLVHHRAVQRARGLRVPRRDRCGRVRERRARGGAPRPALGGLQAGHVQVRARRRVHRGAASAAQDRARPHREDPRARRRGITPRRGGGVAARTRRSSASSMHGKTCAGTWVNGTGQDGRPRDVYLHHIVDNQWSMGSTATRRSSGRPRSTR